MADSSSGAKVEEEAKAEDCRASSERDPGMDGSAASSAGSFSRSFSAYAKSVVSGKQKPPRDAETENDDDDDEEETGETKADREAMERKKRRMLRVRGLMPKLSSSESSRKSFWFKGTITMRSANKKGDKVVQFKHGKKKKATYTDDYAIGTGTTYQPLPEHIETDEFEVPEFDCAQLDKLEQVGKGSQAIVYKTEHAKVWMAVKVLRSQLASQPAELAAFRRECNLLARLTHPNVNNVIGVGTYNGAPCAILEWCALDASRALRLQEVQSSDVRRAVKATYPAVSRVAFVTQLAHAMKFLHSGHALPRCFVLHRDLKPENLGLAGSHATLDGSVASEAGAMATQTLKLLDFGLAVCVEVNDKPPVAKASTRRPEDCLYDLTKETGTMRYMAPEVALGRRYGCKADVYSFAVVSWELLVLGGKPYIGMNSEELYWRVAYEGQRPRIPDAWHPDLRAMFAKAWDPSPSKRPTFADIYATMCRMEALCNSTTSEGGGHRADVLGEALSAQGVCC